MLDPWEMAELAQRFRESAETSRRRAPLNAALGDIVSADRSLTGLLGHAPRDQRLPVLLFAALHDLVLDGLAAELAPWYRTVTETPRPHGDREGLRAAILATVEEYAPRIIETLSTRQVQTNEIGRCSLLLAGLGTIVGADPDASHRPLAHVDVGTSAGLNLLLPRLRYRYDDGVVLQPRTGDGAMPDVAGPLLTCSTRGDGPTPRGIPPISTSVGIDRSPLDATDPDDARWLRACCWPDQTDRFELLGAALDLAAAGPLPIVTGDAVESVGRLVAALDGDQLPVVTTSWVLNYLPPERRSAFVDALDDVGRSRDVAWVFAEAPPMTPELPHAPDQLGDFTTALTTVTWRAGVRSVRHLGLCHPHGYWIHWR